MHNHPTPASPYRSWAGLIVGLMGGLVFGLILTSPLLFLLNLIIYAVLGLVFGLVFGRKIHSMGTALLWGEAYGILWWLVGSLTFIPLMTGGGLAWTLPAMQDRLADLFGHVVGCGLILGLGYYGLSHNFAKIIPGIVPPQPKPSQAKMPIGQDIVPPLLLAVVVGGMGGFISAWVYLRGIETGQFYPLVAQIFGSDSPALGQFLHYAIGVIIGVIFGLLFCYDIKGVGPAIVLGVNYGFLWWILGTLTLLPAFTGQGMMPQWSLELAQARFPALVAHVLYGALVGLFYGLGNQLWRILFVDSDPVNRSLEGVGTRSMRGILMGQLGGIIGGLLYAIVLSNLGAFPDIAQIIGSDSSVVGLLVHTLIGIIVGSTYGLLFQRESYSYGTGLAWGTVYALLWWFMGSMTLYPLLLGQPVNWALDQALAFYPALIGHLLYGAGLGLFFQILARRYDYAISGRAQRGTLGTRLAQAQGTEVRHRTTGRPASALWVVTLALGILLPLLLLSGTITNSGYSGY